MGKRFSVETVFSAIDKMTLPLQRMEGRVGRFSRRSKRAMMGLARMTDRVGGAVFSLGKRFAKLGTFAGIGGGVLMTLMNKSAAQSEVLAKSVGVSVQMVEALAQAIKPAGFEFDNVIDLIEEMNNKLGESGSIEEMAAVKDTMKTLGLEFKNIKDLKPEEQFKTIVDAALQMKDIQQAAFALDSLFSGEGNKILGVLKQRKQSIAQILNVQKEMSFRTDESRKGARQFVSQLAVLETQISSLAFHISGLAGTTVGRFVERVTNAITNNKATIQGFVDELAGSIDDSSKSLSDWVNSLTKSDVRNSIKDLKDLFLDIKYAAEDVTTSLNTFLTPVKWLFKQGQKMRTESQNIKNGVYEIPKNAGAIDAMKMATNNFFGTKLFDVNSSEPEAPQSQSSSTTTRTESVSKSEVRLILPSGVKADTNSPTMGVDIMSSGGLR